MALLSLSDSLSRLCTFHGFPPLSQKVRRDLKNSSLFNILSHDFQFHCLVCKKGFPEFDQCRQHYNICHHFAVKENERKLLLSQEMKKDSARCPKISKGMVSLDHETSPRSQDDGELLRVQDLHTGLQCPLYNGTHSDFHGSSKLHLDRRC